MWETVPAIVAEAVAVGAAAALGDTAKQSVVDAYRLLRELVARRYDQVDVAAVEARPGSVHRRSELAEDLLSAGARDDQELLTAAQSVLAVVRAHEAAAGAAVGVDLERVQAASLRIMEVSSTGAGVRVVDGDFDGDIEIGKVRAGDREQRNPPSAHR